MLHLYPFYYTFWLLWKKKKQNPLELSLQISWHATNPCLHFPKTCNILKKKN